MASSSVSQESLDREDIDTMSTRRCKMRTSRTRCAAYTKEREGISEHLPDGLRDQNGEHHHTSSGNPGDDLEGVSRMSGTTMTSTGGGSAGVDHESPTRATSRTKDKRTRPNHLHKGKPPKDKRKLREKRRSTGVVHLPSTEVSRYFMRCLKKTLKEFEFRFSFSIQMLTCGIGNVCSFPLRYHSTRKNETFQFDRL